MDREIIALVFSAKRETTFGRINLIGNVEVALKVGKADTFNWKSKTIRQADNDVASTEMKLKIRLNDEVTRGVRQLLEESL